MIKCFGKVILILIHLIQHSFTEENCALLVGIARSRTTLWSKKSGKSDAEGTNSAKSIEAKRNGGNLLKRHF
jgi:hypothetical protein